MAVKWTKTTLANLVAIVAHIEKDNAERAKSFILRVQHVARRGPGASNSRTYPFDAINGIQRMVARGQLRRIDGGLYDRPAYNLATSCPRLWPGLAGAVEALPNPCLLNRGRSGGGQRSVG